MAVDREKKEALEKWEARIGEMRSHVVDKRRLDHEKLGRLQGPFQTLDPEIWVPKWFWDQLRYHERWWLAVWSALITSRSAVIVSRSAARLHGMWVVSRTRERIEVTLRSRGGSPSRKRSGRYLFRHQKLREDELVQIEGGRVTNPVRTFFDIARFHGFEEGLVAVDYLLRRGVELEDISAAASRLGRIKNVATIRQCIRHATPLSQSPYESLARALLIRAGIGPIEVQFRIDGYSVDLLVNGWLIIEIDGKVKYEGQNAEEVRQAEFNRQKRIGNKGYVFLRFEPEYLLRDPEGFIAQVRETLAARHPVAATP